MNKIFKYFLCLLYFFSVFGCSQIDKDVFPFKITFIDVGKGDAALIECDKHFMLIDGGPVSSGDKVKSVLEDNEVNHLDIVAISHFHLDHYGGFQKGLSNITRIDKIISNCNKSDEIKNKVLNNSTIMCGSIQTPKPKQKFRLGDAKIEVLDTGTSNKDNESLILLITYKKTKYLFTGDMPEKMQLRMCDKYDDDFKIDVLKVPHHGGNNKGSESSRRFVNMLQPIYSVISVGSPNEYDHPGQTTLNHLNQVDSKIYRTDQNGDVEICSNGRRIKVRTEK